MLNSRDLLVSAATGDDAGVYRLDAHRALVQTTDFFTPIVDNPVSYGQIAAANALSDVYAMGGRPLTALAIVGMPADRVPVAVVNRILRAGAAKIKEAKCVLLGGHTIRSPEPIYGFAFTGLVSARRMLTIANARVGDLLVLTKPLGTGIVTTAIKRDSVGRSLEWKSIRSMTHLNTVGPELAEKHLSRAAVDVTGFGLLGHLFAMCRASRVGARIYTSKVPALSNKVFDLISKGFIPGGTRDNLAYANEFTDWGDVTASQRVLLADAQTSGGLLFSIPPKNLKSALKYLSRNVLCAALIGKVVRSNEPRIQVSA